MFKAIAAYLIGRKIVGFIVCAAMMIGLLAVCLIAYAFVPEARADEMNPYAGSTYVNRDPRYGTCVLTVNADGTCLLSFPERNDRVGYYYNYYIGENGEMVAVDENNDAVLSASMNDGNFLSDADGYLWYAE